MTKVLQNIVPGPTGLTEKYIRVDLKGKRKWGKVAFSIAKVLKDFRDSLRTFKCSLRRLLKQNTHFCFSYNRLNFWFLKQNTHFWVSYDRSRASVHQHRPRGSFFLWQFHVNIWIFNLEINANRLRARGDYGSKDSNPISPPPPNPHLFHLSTRSPVPHPSYPT